MPPGPFFLNSKRTENRFPLGLLCHVFLVADLTPPIICLMRTANYPASAVHSYKLLLQAEILPLLGPSDTAYPSWMTDDHTPVEFSLALSNNGEMLIRFAIEASALRLSGDRSIKSLRKVLQNLSHAMPMKPDFDLHWFDICGEELLLGDTQPPLSHVGPASETFIGFDCGHHFVSMKVYFMPRSRALVTQQSPKEMLARTATRLGLAEPWSKITQFLSHFLPGGTLQGDDVSVGLTKARVLWDALTADGPPEQRLRYFASGLVYYELRPDGPNPTSKVYFPVQRHLSNDLSAAKAIDRLTSHLPIFSPENPYSGFIQTVFPHQELSSRSGIHTYACCTVKPVGSEISLYLNPEAFAPERKVGLRGALAAQIPTLSPFDAHIIARFFVRQWELFINGAEDASFCFAPECCLRDLLVFSPSFRMLQGKHNIVHHVLSVSRTFRSVSIVGTVTFKALSHGLCMIL
ncbi:tryptophan dimethylallyl transferase variant 1 [Favolaschia claudopus]|uniref:Tryptophan dimethylallyl transferase variant 1 n=1 Tax=Favolaschia claudopus TaxID=2862362 RepID=A0AAW0A3Z5_9AGAR